MRPPLSLFWLSTALALRAFPAAAGDGRASEAGARPNPIVNTGGVVPAASGVGAAPAIGALGVAEIHNAPVVAPAASASAGASAAAVPSAGAAAVGAPAAAAPAAADVSLQPRGAADPGASLMTLDGAARQVRQGRQLEAAGSESSTAQALDKVFDAAKSLGSRLAAPSGAVAGAVQSVQRKVRQIAHVADTASAANAPALYKEAIRVAEQAALDKLIAADTARAVAETVVRQAFAHAKRFLPELAGDAYKAASQGSGGRAGVEKAFRSFGDWDRFLGGGPSRPLVPNIGDLRADVERTLAAASQPAARANGVPRKVVFLVRGDSYVADIPARGPSAAKPIPVADFLKTLSLDPGATAMSAPAAGALSPTGSVLGDMRRIYEGHRGAGKGRSKAAVAAAAYAAKASTRSFWEFLKDRLLGRTPDPVAALRREPVEAERALLAERPAGTGAAFLDLARLSRQERQGEQAVARGVRTAGQLKRLLALASDEAAQYAALSGDHAASAAVAVLRARAAAALALPDETPLPAELQALAAPDTPGALAYWLTRVPQAAFDRLDRHFLSVAKRENFRAFGYGDLSEAPGAMARLVAVEASPALVAELGGLGFETEIGAGGALRAWTSGPNLAGRLAAALDRAAGAGSPRAPEVAMAARAAAFALAHPAEARKQAERFQAQDPTFSGFSPVGLVAAQGRSFLAESAERYQGKRLLRAVVLRDPATRKPRFGFLEPAKASRAR